VLLVDSGHSSDDTAEQLLMLEVHFDLAKLYIYVIVESFSTTVDCVENDGKYKFKNISLHKNLRCGTTILLRRSPTVTYGYVLDTKPTDLIIDINFDKFIYL